MEWIGGNICIHWGSEMEYEKCYRCPHSQPLYMVGGGLFLVCNITGEVLKIKHCPYGEERHDDN